MTDKILRFFNNGKEKNIDSILKLLASILKELDVGDKAVIKSTTGIKYAGESVTYIFTKASDDSYDTEKINASFDSSGDLKKEKSSCGNWTEMKVLSVSKFDDLKSIAFYEDGNKTPMLKCTN